MKELVAEGHLQKSAEMIAALEEQNAALEEKNTELEGKLDMLRSVKYAIWCLERSQLASQSCHMAAMQ